MMMILRLKEFPKVTMLIDDYASDVMVGFRFYIDQKKVSRHELEEATKMRLPELMQAMMDGKIKTEE